ncbi:MAG: DUF1667 domain-containing protein [Lachnospiraceae bacterium]|nr:DUF1667 domain-containing protein [Candidatus Darwinimomas equi]
MKNRTFTCIICPNGCDIAVEYDDEGYFRCEGNLCPKGEKYVLNELTAPQRTISSSVVVDGGELPLASVRLNGPVPKDRIFDVMKEIRAIRLKAPVKAGTVLIKNIFGFDSDLIVTRNVEKKA